MARKMVNPDISLFHPVPEGSLTHQPNPNSIVQNDEARGVDHLDFFRFVGRLVGKALFDGQSIDAYFTRSFYKHMLGQRLTYQVRQPPGPQTSMRCVCHIPLWVWPVHRRLLHAQLLQAHAGPAPDLPGAAASWASNAHALCASESHSGCGEE